MHFCRPCCTAVGKADAFTMLDCRDSAPLFNLFILVRAFCTSFNSYVYPVTTICWLYLRQSKGYAAHADSTYASAVAMLGFRHYSSTTVLYVLHLFVVFSGGPRTKNRGPTPYLNEVVGGKRGHK